MDEKNRFAHLPPDDIPEAARAELEGYRAELDKFDQELVELMGRRFEVVNKVGVLKSKHSMPTIQPIRAQAVIDRAADRAPDHGLAPYFMRAIYEAIIDYAHDLEKEIVKDHD